MEIDMNIPRPEHPRPLLQRDDWLNLNGKWSFAFDDTDIGTENDWKNKTSLGQSIVVPYAYQTKASTINDQSIHEVVWYSREFEVPQGWNDGDVLLHFGAVDYLSRVWINGQEVGMNVGGHVPFSFNVTPYLIEGSNHLSVRVEDMQDPEQPRGKQSVDGTSHDIDYYCTTGIWQTVWLESAPSLRIDDITVVPRARDEEFSITAFLHAPTSKWRLEVTLLDGEKIINTVSVQESKTVITTVMPVPDAVLWTPDNPKLYDFRIRLFMNDTLLDEIHSYGGLRDVGITKDYLTLNQKPLYLAMVLDQGYWPESGMTALHDDDFKTDIEWIKKYGYNGVRKHQKAEDPRWLYWCDKLGVLVWGEMANAREWSHSAEERLMNEWQRILRRDYNNPCIITWVPINESWGVPGLSQEHHIQYAYVEKLVTLTRRIDHTRPVVDNDGWEHTDIGDICAIHDYTPTAKSLKERYANTLSKGILPEKVWLRDTPLFAGNAEYRGQPIILTEVGGYLLLPEDKKDTELDILYSEYGTSKSTEEMLDQYADLCEGLGALTFISGFCYTQLTDIEQEQNGLLTIDRRTKVPADQLYALNQELIQRFYERTLDIA